MASDSAQKVTIPDSANHDTPEQSLISSPNMGRVKQPQRTMDIQERTTTKTLPTAKTSRNLTTPGIKDCSTKMLSGASQITQQGSPGLCKVSYLWSTCSWGSCKARQLDWVEGPSCPVGGTEVWLSVSRSWATAANACEVASKAAPFEGHGEREYR